MRALVTGASSGIGTEIALLLDSMGYEVILTARRRERLEALAKRLQNPSKVIAADLTKREECFTLIDAAGDVDVLVNGAGFGVFGEFDRTALDAELSLIDVNITALHILTKHYWKRFLQRGSGYVLNIASVASFFPGPKFSSYYASKAYVLRLSEALYQEQKRHKNAVSISVFCPGPVNTEFNDVAGVRFALKGISAKEAARCAVKGMFQKKRIIACPLTVRFLRVLSKITPDAVSLYFVSKMQEKKEGRK